MAHGKRWTVRFTGTVGDEEFSISPYLDDLDGYRMEEVVAEATATVLGAIPTFRIHGVDVDMHCETCGHELSSALRSDLCKCDRARLSEAKE